MSAFYGDGQAIELGDIVVDEHGHRGQVRAVWWGWSQQCSVVWEGGRGATSGGTLGLSLVERRPA